MGGTRSRPVAGEPLASDAGESEERQLKGPSRWTSVPTDMIRNILCFLPLDMIPNAAAVSHHFRDLLDGPESNVIWANLLPLHMVGRAPLSGNIRLATRQLLERKKCWERGLRHDAHDAQFKITYGVYASSTDHDTQSLFHALEVRDKETFWSSCGDTSTGASEYLVYTFGVRPGEVGSDDFGLLSTIQIKFFKAMYQYMDHQGGHPIYPSQELRISVGWFPEDVEFIQELKRREKLSTRERGSKTGSETGVKKVIDSLQWHYESPSFPVLHNAEVQTFRLPCLVPGNILRIDLLGKVQTQAEDQQYYTCIESIEAYGSRASSLPREAEQVVHEVSSVTREKKTGFRSEEVGLPEFPRYYWG